MRGQVDRQQSMFVVFNLEDRIPDDHPLRPIKAWCDRALAGMSRDFNNAYSTRGRDSIPPETLIKALLIRALYSIPSESRLCEAIEFNLLYRWFIDWPLDRKAFTPEVFSVNRDRFEMHDLVRKFFERIIAEAMAQGLLDGDHLTVDGALIRSLAGKKSMKRIDNDHENNDDLNTWAGFKGEKISNKTHRSVVDPRDQATRGDGVEPHRRRHRTSHGAQTDACKTTHTELSRKPTYKKDDRAGDRVAEGHRPSFSHAFPRSAAHSRRRVTRCSGVESATNDAFERGHLTG